MKANELIEKFGSPLDLRLRSFALFLADHIPDARLADGCRLCDGTDFAAWLHELANTRPTPAPREFKDCPRCGHIHEGDRECGALIGAGRRCRCELEVLA